MKLGIPEDWQLAIQRIVASLKTPVSSPATVDPAQNIEPSRGECDSYLTDEQRRLLKFLESEDVSCFVTGSAGTGKSTLLRHLVQSTKKRVMVVAPTGIAALNVNGDTIHSAFRLPIHLVDEAWIEVNTNRVDGLGVFETIKNVEILVIDEASMVSSVLMDQIDARLRFARNSVFPFGGVQTVLFGDLLQLPAFTTDAAILDYVHSELGGLGFYRSLVWREGDYPTLELTQPMRQLNRAESSLLERVRQGQSSSDDLNEINTRVIGAGVPWSSGVLTLCATNARANRVNQTQLGVIAADPKSYQVQLRGEFNKRPWPVEEVVTLKIGAQVMAVKTLMRTFATVQLESSRDYMRNLLPSTSAELSTRYFGRPGIVTGMCMIAGSARFVLSLKDN